MWAEKKIPLYFYLFMDFNKFLLLYLSDLKAL